MHSKKLVISAQILSYLEFGHIDVSAEVWKSRAIGKMGIMVMGVVGMALAEQGLGLPSVLRLPAFSCLGDVPMIFHGLAFISFDNRVCLWSWLGEIW